MTISQQIEAELRMYVSTGEEAPYRLTLEAMAEHFGASIQPARTAVTTLLSENWLLRNETGGLVMNPRKKGKGVPDDNQNSVSRLDIGELLEESIIRHSLRGESVFLREEETATQFNVGRSVLREMFNRLTGDGLLEHIPRRGWQVRAYSEEQMLDYLEVRETLELRALDLAQDRFEVKELGRLIERNTPSPNDPLRIDNGLHAYWTECAGNRYITDFFAQHSRYYAALFDYATLAGAIVEEMAAQHREILEALIQGEQVKARRILRQHIRAQRPNITRMLELAAGAQHDS